MTSLTPAPNQHVWVPSRLGHGGAMCSKCLITNLEAAVQGLLNTCDFPNKPGKPFVGPTAPTIASGTAPTIASGTAAGNRVKIAITFDSDQFEEIKAQALQGKTSFTYQVRMLCALGLAQLTKGEKDHD